MHKTCPARGANWPPRKQAKTEGTEGNAKAIGAKAGLRNRTEGKEKEGKGREGKMTRAGIYCLPGR
jgi:hypothetical protein